MDVIEKVATIKERQWKQDSQVWFDGEIADETKNHNRLFKKIKKLKLHIDKDINNVERYKSQKIFINKKKTLLKIN